MGDAAYLGVGGHSKGRVKEPGPALSDSLMCCEQVTCWAESMRDAW
jgi:hypothetical protein